MMRAEVKQQLDASLPGVIANAVDNSFDKLSTTMQKLEARQAKQDRRLHEMGGQLSAMQDQLTNISGCLEKVAQGGIGNPNPTAAAPPTPRPKVTTTGSSTSSVRPATPAEKYNIGTPRGARGDTQRDVDDEASVLVHWPHRAHKEHLVAIDSRMVEFYGNAISDDSFPSFPKGGTTYGVNFEAPGMRRPSGRPSRGDRSTTTRPTAPQRRIDALSRRSLRTNAPEERFSTRSSG